MKKEKLTLRIQMGHKGPALVFPFDPAKKWGKPARHFVTGTLSGCRFIGEIGSRRGVFYTLLDDELLAAAKAKTDDEVEVTVEPREPSDADLATPANLVWSKLAAQPPMRRKR